MKWLSVKGYEGLYVINELGQVKSLMYGKILPAKTTKHGVRVTLNRKGTMNYVYIEKLIKEVFK